MDIIIQSLGFNASENLENFIREKLASLKSEKIVRANVTLYKGPEGNPENNYCEIRLEMPGNDPFVKKTSAFFETSVSECVEVLNMMLVKSRDKQLDRRQADPTVIQDSIITDGEATGLDDAMK